MKYVISFGEERAAISVSCNRAKWNNMSRFHTHPFYELYHVVEGERYFFVGNGVYHIREGDTLLISPETEHRSLDANGEGYAGLVVNIPVCHLPEGTHPEGELCMVRASSDAAEALSLDASALLSSAEGEVSPLDSYLAVMRMLSRVLAEREGTPEPGIVSPTLDRMAEILVYLEEHYTEGISLAALSEKFYISEFYLCRLFKEYTGRTVLDYLTDLRVRRAKKLLSSTADPVGRIARDSGFGSVSAFGKAFKTRVGTSPREYRQAIKQKG